MMDKPNWMKPTLGGGIISEELEGRKMDKLERLSDDYINSIENLYDNHMGRPDGFEECQRMRPPNPVHALAKESRLRGRERDALVERCELLEYMLNRSLNMMCRMCRQGWDAAMTKAGITIPPYRPTPANEMPRLRSLEIPPQPRPPAADTQKPDRA
jgi:hypothetical protein